MKKNIAFKHVRADLAFVVVFLGWVMNAQAVSSPSSVTMKILEMRVSKNSDCSGAVSVFATASPTPVNMDSNPDLGSGVISTGTYHCVMFNISDAVTFIPKDSVEPLCVAGTAYSADLFQSGSPDSIAPDRTTHITARTAIEDFPWIYFSDAASAIKTQPQGYVLSCLQPGNACSMAPFVVLSDQARSLVADFDLQLGPVTAGVPPCTTYVPVLSIR
jgi:hypothetical protein